MPCGPGRDPIGQRHATTPQFDTCKRKLAGATLGCHPENPAISLGGLRRSFRRARPTVVAASTSEGGLGSDGQSHRRERGHPGQDGPGTSRHRRRRASPDPRSQRRPGRRRRDQRQAGPGQVPGGLRATHEDQPSHNTVVGHSYGSTVVGHTPRDLTIQADEVVFIGSPGVGVTQASELNLPPERVHSSTAQHDVIKYTNINLGLDRDVLPLDPLGSRPRRGRSGSR
ncbi:alpha/beta hydrolase [Crossiella sp. CA198]|uniref:alpha/beta hydrolase n=1 Tax=Crossiella sp. CA198 TaxID=3455607 RepID=UPI003F8D6D0F